MEKDPTIGYSVLLDEFAIRASQEPFVEVVVVAKNDAEITSEGLRKHRISDVLNTE